MTIKTTNLAPDGDLRTRGEMMLQHAIWYIKATSHHYDRLTAGDYLAVTVLHDLIRKVKRYRIETTNKTSAT